MKEKIRRAADELRREHRKVFRHDALSRISDSEKPARRTGCMPGSIRKTA